MYLKDINPLHPRKNGKLGDFLFAFLADDVLPLLRLLNEPLAAESTHLPHDAPPVKLGGIADGLASGGFS